MSGPKKPVMGVSAGKKPSDLRMDWSAETAEPREPRERSEVKRKEGAEGGVGDGLGAEIGVGAGVDAVLSQGPMGTEPQSVRKEAVWEAVLAPASVEVMV